MRLMKVPHTNNLTWPALFKQVAGRIGEHHIMIFAGNMSFGVFMAMFPLFVFLLSLLGAFGAEQLVRDGVDSIRGFLPQEATILIQDQLLEIAQTRSNSAFTFAAVLSATIALWGVSSFMRTLMESLNVMYSVKDTRSFIKRYLLSIALAVSATVMIVGSFILLNFGFAIADNLGDYFNLGSQFVLMWKILQWPVMIILMLTALDLMYYIAPDIDVPFKIVTIGAVFSTIMWLIFTFAFSLYVNNFGSYNATYGALAGLILFLLYMLYTSVIILLGAEVNNIIDSNRAQGQARRWWHRLAAIGQKG